MLGYIAPQDSGAIRDAAKEILSQPEFAQPDYGWMHQVASFFQGITNQVSEWVSAAWSEFENIFLEGLGAGGAWAVPTVSAVLILLGLVKLFWSTSSDQALTPAALHASAEVSLEEMIADAERREVEGDWRNAIRMRYGILIAQLSNAGVVRRRLGGTTGEYGNEVLTNAPAMGSSFLSATKVFESAWYGSGDPGRDDLEELHRQSREVHKALGLAWKPSLPVTKREAS